MEFLIVLFIGMCLGWKYREYTAVKIMAKHKEDIANKPPPKIELTIENTGGRLYAYLAHDGSFAAQGDNWDKLTEALRDRYPGRKFKANEDNLKDVGFYS